MHLYGQPLIVLIYETSTCRFSLSGIPQNLFLSGKGSLSISLITGAIPISIRESLPPLEITPGIVLGSLVGSYSASIISGEVLVNIFICLAFLIALNMAFQRDPIIISTDIPKSKFINLIISSLIGFMSVLIGIGGGSFSVPTLTMFSKKIHEAVGTSATLGFFIAFPGAIILIISGSNIDVLPPLSFGYLNIAIVLLVSSTSIFTANLGAKVSVNVNKVTLRRIFSIFLLFTCISLIIEHYII